MAQERSAGEHHGGLLLINLGTRLVERKFEYAEPSASLRTRPQHLGLRGVASHEGHIYLAASDRLFKLSSDFREIGAWENAYLMHAGEVEVRAPHAFVVSSDHDSILGFNLKREAFDWALHVDLRGHAFRGRIYDPQESDGPLRLGKLGLNDIHVNEHGMYMSGERSHGMLHFNGRAVRMAAELPGGAVNARPFRDGVLFNESDSGCLRYSGRGDGREDRALRLSSARTRGLCALSESLVAVGTCPAGLAVFDLARNEEVMRLRISEDPDVAIQSLALV